MTSRSLRDDIKLELKLRLLPILKKDLNYHLQVDVNLFHLETIEAGWKDEWRSFPAGDFFSILRPDQSRPRAWVVAGNVGSGRTTLARSLLQSWLTRDFKFQNIDQYEGIFIIDGEDLEKEETLPLIQTILPDTICHWGIDELFDWLETTKVLLIVDDLLLDTDQEHKLTTLLDEWKGADALVLTSLEDGIKVIDLLDSVKPVLYCRFKRLNFQSQSIVAQTVLKELCQLEGKPSFNTDFLQEHKILEPLFETFGGIQNYCKFVNEFPQSCLQKTVTSFVWDSIYEHLNRMREKHSLPIDKLDEWVTILGKRCYECLAGSAPLLGEEVLPLFEATKYLFPNITNSSFLVELLLSVRHSLYNDDSTFCVLHHTQQRVLAAFYLLRRIMEGMPLKRLLKPIKRDDVYDDLAIYVGGLLTKLVTEENKFFKPLNEDLKKREKKIERVLKNLSLQTELSPDPIAFILKILHELECREQLVELFLRDIVLPSQLHVHEVGIYAKALERLLHHSYPSKIHLLIRRGNKSPEIYETLKLIKDHDVNLALMDMNLLEWGGACRSDELLQILFDGKGIKLQDFIGCLEESTIRKLHLNEAMRHIVCLRVRVCDTQSAKSLIDTHKHLPHLMWLEIDFDFSLSQLFSLNLPPISAPLVDFSVNRVTDADIEKLCDFLHSIGRQFAGLHIHQSSVSPQGVTELLKYFFRRDMRLTADPKTISKYRKYRFPELGSRDLKQNLDDDEVERLLGYADRHHYSDNEVRSSYVAKYSEVDPLKHFFSIIELTYFVYSCANFQVTKETNGNCYVKRSLI